MDKKHDEAICSGIRGLKHFHDVEMLLENDH